MDRRIAYTGQALANAPIELVLEQGYDSLSIRAVAQHAGGGYRTFFRLYRSLDHQLVELLKSAFQELKERAFRATTPNGKNHAMYAFIR